MKSHPSSKIRAFPLQLVLIVPFVLQVFGVVGLIGYLSLFIIRLPIRQQASSAARNS